MSPARSWRCSCSIACSAASSLPPSIDSERSTTNTKCAGGRSTLRSRTLCSTPFSRTRRSLAFSDRDERTRSGISTSSTFSVSIHRRRGGRHRSAFAALESVRPDVGRDRVRRQRRAEVEGDAVGRLARHAGQHAVDAEIDAIDGRHIGADLERGRTEHLCAGQRREEGDRRREQRHRAAQHRQQRRRGERANHDMLRRGCGVVRGSPVDDVRHGRENG